MRLLKRLPSNCISDFHSITKAIAMRLQSDYKSDYQAIVKHLPSDCQAIAKVFQSDCKSERQAITITI
jgi:phage major head subunit gpT-like protein